MPYADTCGMWMPFLGLWASAKLCCCKSCVFRAGLTAKLKSRGYDSSCHRNHIHISLSWDGAMGRTSFWTKRVRSTVDYGVCRWKGMNWAPRYFHARTTPCTNYPALKAKKGSSDKDDEGAQGPAPSMCT